MSSCLRFDSKRFCRDCRRNVIREFKELKELKRMRREPRCTSWFCVADTAFQYEVLLSFSKSVWFYGSKECKELKITRKVMLLILLLVSCINEFDENSY